MSSKAPASADHPGLAQAGEFGFVLVSFTVANAVVPAPIADLLLLVIIAILLPPLAMALYDGITSRFWISLLLTLLFYLPGLIYTLVIILGEN